MKTASQSVSFKIQSREHLLSALAEASELEHNLMCLYLYAVFSLKESLDEGITADELKFIQAWRKQIMEVAIQEMMHLTLVSNLTIAVGGSPHFNRPSFPVKPGYYPAEFVIELAPFSLKTIEHFIFLERPEASPVQDSEEFKPETEYQRDSSENRLMAYTGNYETVGQLYRTIKEGIAHLCQQLGEAELFCGAASLQLLQADIDMEELKLISSQSSAHQAIDTVVEQGEGSSSPEGSHFAKFEQIKVDLERLLQENPNFNPARDAARNPVMRKPAHPEGKIWITQPMAVQHLDLGNAIYSLMLRFLTQVYAVHHRSRENKKILVDGAFTLMHLTAKFGKALSVLPATLDSTASSAGMSFSLNRDLSALEASAEKLLLRERVMEIHDFIRDESELFSNTKSEMWKLDQALAQLS